MQILPAQIRTGSIVLNESMPLVAVGKTVIATVLSMPKGGSVLVSMFGKRLMVETTIPLEKGQVINLQVHAVSPKVILKPVQMEAAENAASMKEIAGILSRIVGSHGEKPLSSFLVQDIVKNLPAALSQDGPSAQFVASVIDQIYQYPNALAYLFIPITDGDSGSSAQVAIERDEGAYVLSFDMETENLGSIACRARMEKEKGIDVEIRTPSAEVAAFLKGNIHELNDSLASFGVRSIEVVRGSVRKVVRKEVDVLV